MRKAVRRVVQRELQKRSERRRRELPRNSASPWKKQRKSSRANDGTIRTRTTGVILCDHARMLDLNSRNAEFAEKAPEDVTAEAVDLIIGFVERR